MADKTKDIKPNKEALDKLKRKAVFEICTSKDMLKNWVQLFLGLDLPDCTVDPESNSNPMDLIWEIYQKAVAGNDPDFTQVLAYSARMSFKSVSCSVMCVLSLLHWRRSMCIMAALEQQSRVNLGYVSKFLNMPYLKDYLVGNTRRQVEVSWFQDEEGNKLSPIEYKNIENKEDYIEKNYKLLLIVATPKSANSFHGPFLCVGGDTEVKTNQGKLTARQIFKKLGGDDTQKEFADYNIDDKELKVLSLNFEKASFEFKRPINIFKRQSQTIKITLDNGKSLICTPDHKNYVFKKGFIETCDLKLEDELATSKVKTEYKSKPYINEFKEFKYEFKGDVDEWDQVMLGSMLGDGGLYKRGNQNPYFTEQHCVEQADYLAWKREIFSRKVRTINKKGAKSGYTGEAQVGFSSANSVVLMPYVGFKQNLQGVERLGPLGLAVWYMDDGVHGRTIRFSTENFTVPQQEYLATVLKNKFDIDVKVMEYYDDEDPEKIYYYLGGDKPNKIKLATICKPYIHKTMEYKFDYSENLKTCINCGKQFYFYRRNGSPYLYCDNAICKLIFKKKVELSKIVNIEQIVDFTDVYDFTLEENHNFWGCDMLSHQCMDELDLTPKGPLEESKLIPDRGEEGQLPITFYTSSRKYSIGNVQNLIDNAHESGTHIRHWNIIDVTEACPETRNLSKKGRVTIYNNDKLLKAISEKEYELLPTDRQKAFEKDEGYVGCLKNCKIFSACKGRLATEQKSKSNLLKNISTIQAMLRQSDVDYVHAQLLCHKPSREGMVFSRLDRDVHKISANKIMEKITGEVYPQSMSKEVLINLLKQQEEVQFYAGLDHGMTHCFAMTVGAKHGKNIYIIEAFEIPELELGQRIDVMNQRIKKYNPVIYADPAEPASNTTIKKSGYKLKDWNKAPGSVVGGIELVRLKLNPTIGEPEMFFLDEDEGVNTLFKHMSEYHWKTDIEGNPTNIPKDVNDDGIDATRYMVMNVFEKGGRVVVPAISTMEGGNSFIDSNEKFYDRNTWVNDVIQENLVDNGEAEDFVIIKDGKGFSFKK